MLAARLWHADADCCNAQGWDKTYCLRYVENDFDDIHFFGDKTFVVRQAAVLHALSACRAERGPLP